MTSTPSAGRLKSEDLNVPSFTAVYLRVGLMLTREENCHCYQNGNPSNVLLFCDSQVQSCHKPKSSMTPMTPVKSWLLQMLLEWVLTCRCLHTAVEKMIQRLFINVQISKSSVFSHLLFSPSLYRSIKRIIFNSLIKPNINEKGEKQMETISTSQALQIAGRAGRSALGSLPWFLFRVVRKC